MTVNKGIIFTLNFVSSLLPVILAYGSTSYTEGGAPLMLHHLYHSIMFFVYLNSRLICCLLADSQNL